MEEFSCEFKDEDNDIKEKLNLNNFNFSFDGKIKLNQEDVLPKENIEIVKKIKGLKSIFLYNNSFSKGFKDKIKINDKDNSLYNVRLYL